jgi:SAM-dependent methyltransferase
MPLHPDKIEAINQWEADPCGAVAGLDPDNRVSWEQVDANRYKSYAPWMLRTIGFERYSGKRVLEVGFGLGTDLMQFARGGSQVYGIEITPRHVELARRRFDAFSLRARLTRGDAETLPYKSASFDVVYSFGVLHHTPDMISALEEIHRVLRPGGVLILSLYHRWSLDFLFNVIWSRGIRQGEFFRTDWRTVLAHVERRSAASKACPRVDVFTRSQIRRACGMFQTVSLTTRHIGIDVRPVEAQDGLVKAMLKRLFLASRDRLGRMFGWYLIAVATK